jgi:hypothetical protein
VDRDFGHWLAGFLDGEAHFYVTQRGQSGSWQCGLVVNLRADDRELLLLIKDQTGVGKIYYKPVTESGFRARPGARPQAQWAVDVKRDVLTLADILDDFPLRSKKARDFAIWREAVGVWAGVRKGGVKRDAEQKRLGELAARLVAGRAFLPTQVVY